MTNAALRVQIAHARAAADETYSAYQAADDAWFMMLAVEEADDAARAVRLDAAARAAIRARDAAAFAYETAKHAAARAVAAAARHNQPA
ncbi:hypothetical protein UFOVP761_12 [uncultured Caudovirales phage]|uniref:Uncharacterized protein n=1 Tax=uncultured Caudovirales phage TaxID=2100421 RepID=A0A6J5NVR8_9CAUD|nr:hypothetical protein UFOVP761_12 [uncultured Caudovirales phage]